MTSMLWGLGPSKARPSTARPSAAHLDALEKERRQQEAAKKRRDEKVALVKKRQARDAHPPPLVTARSMPAMTNQVWQEGERCWRFAPKHNSRFTLMVAHGVRAGE
jgi:hypothetical protein